MCVCANPIHGWRVAWGEPLVKLVCSHSWPLDAMFWVGTHRVDMVPLPSDVKLKVPLAAATAPWLLILIQSLSLQEAQERPLDSSDWMKPEEYDPDAKQVNAKEWAGLFVTWKRASGFCICEWSRDHSMNTRLACLSVGLKCQLSLHSTPRCSQPFAVAP